MKIILSLTCFIQILRITENTYRLQHLIQQTPSGVDQLIAKPLSSSWAQHLKSNETATKSVIDLWPKVLNYRQMSLFEI